MEESENGGNARWPAVNTGYTTTIGDTVHHVTFDGNGRCEVDGKPVDLQVTPQPGGRYAVLLGVTPWSFTVRREGAAVIVSSGGRECAVNVESDRERALRRVAPVQNAGKSRNEIVAPMPALVVRIHVAAGDAVQEGQALLALEAMKMENEIKAPRSGIVREVRATQGGAVEKGEVLIVLE